MQNPIDGEVVEIVDEALARATRVAEGGIPTMVAKWVVVAEFTNAEGKTWCMRFGSPESATWDRMGLLQFGLTCEQDTVMHGSPSEEDD